MATSDPRDDDTDKMQEEPPTQRSRIPELQEVKNIAAGKTVTETDNCSCGGSTSNGNKKDRKRHKQPSRRAQGKRSTEKEGGNRYERRGPGQSAMQAPKEDTNSQFEDREGSSTAVPRHETTPAPAMNDAIWSTMESGVEDDHDSGDEMSSSMAAVPRLPGAIPVRGIHAGRTESYQYLAAEESSSFTSSSPSSSSIENEREYDVQDRGEEGFPASTGITRSPCQEASNSLQENDCGGGDKILTEVVATAVDDISIVHAMPMQEADVALPRIPWGDSGSVATAMSKSSTFTSTFVELLRNRRVRRIVLGLCSLAFVIAGVAIGFLAISSSYFRRNSNNLRAAEAATTQEMPMMSMRTDAITKCVPPSGWPCLRTAKELRRMVAAAESGDMIKETTVLALCRGADIQLDDTLAVRRDHVTVCCMGEEDDGNKKNASSGTSLMRPPRNNKMCTIRGVDSTVSPLLELRSDNVQLLDLVLAIPQEKDVGVSLNRDTVDKSGIVVITGDGSHLVRNVDLIGGIAANFHGNGGNLHVNGMGLANLTVDRVNFVSGFAADGGGGLFAQDMDHVTIHNCHFQDCAAGYGGGFAVLDSVDLTVVGSTFEDNMSSRNGGAGWWKIENPPKLGARDFGRGDGTDEALENTGSNNGALKICDEFFCGNDDPPICLMLNGKPRQ